MQKTVKTASRVESLSYYKIHFPDAKSAVSHKQALQHKQKFREMLKSRSSSNGGAGGPLKNEKRNESSVGCDSGAIIAQDIEMSSERACKSELIRNDIKSPMNEE